MNINELNPKTVTVLDILTNNKSCSSRGYSRAKHDYVTDMEYSDRKGNVLVNIPYEAHQLLEQALFLIRLANHSIEINKNIRY